MLAVLDKSKTLVQKARNGRTERNAQINGALGEGNKERDCKVVFTPDPPDRQFTLMSVFQVSLGENVRPLMKAVVKNCPNFELLATTCLVQARTASTLPVGGIRAESHVIGEDHLFGPETKKWVAELVKGLEADAFTCQDMCRFSVNWFLGVLWNGANLRDEDILFLRANTASYRNDEGRFVIRPPGESGCTGLG